jgi:peptidoglycan L-alanyl-D-glutamate endopeptidase CwlK
MAMKRWGVVPPEVPVQRELSLLAPKMQAATTLMLAELLDVYDLPVMGFETLRTRERQAFLYGHGRDYSDGRGIVTNAQTHLYSFHGYGLAIDVVEKDATPWDAPPSFWNAIGEVAEKHGLAWGGRWKTPDLPHVQWGKCPKSPAVHDRELIEAGGLEAVWRKYGAL